MATRIRLARAGAKKRPFYRIVVADARSPRDGRFIEKIGIYNPLLSKEDPKRIELKEERVKYWLGQGASPSDRVEAFLVAANLFARDKARQKVLDDRLAKTQAIKKAKEEEEAKVKAEAAKQAAEEAKAAEEAAKAAEAEAAPAAEEKPAE